MKEAELHKHLEKVIRSDYQNIDPKMYSSGVGVLGKKSSWKRYVNLVKDFR
jgi:hypothetical protein